MAMRISAARQVVRGSGARPVLRGRRARLAVRPSAARQRTSAPQRTGWTWPWGQQPEAPAPAADPTMLLTILVSLATIIGAQKFFIDDINAVLTGKLEVNTKELTGKLEGNTKELTANTASIKELKSEVNTKLDALSANVQAEQVKTAELQGQVTILREGWKKK